MSREYDDYLDQHIYFVRTAWSYLKNSVGLVRLRTVFPDLDEAMISVIDERVIDHDRSKYSYAEYGPYDEHFYGLNRGLKQDPDYDRAWLSHIQDNEHHWQHWVLIRDEGELVPIDMPTYCVIEMICDWWSFSFSAYMERGEHDIDDLYGILGWYEDHKSKMVLSDNTRKDVEGLLSAIMSYLDGKRGDGDGR